MKPELRNPSENLSSIRMLQREKTSFALIVKTFTLCQSSSGFLLIFFCFFDVYSIRVACVDFVGLEKEYKTGNRFAKDF